MISVKFKHIGDAPHAIMPEYKTKGSAGVDLAIPQALNMQAGELTRVPLGFALEIPEGYEGQVRSRSGLASQGIIVMNQPGTIDSDYTGEVGVLLLNMSPTPVTFQRGDRIAQLVFNKVEQATFEESAELTETERGSGGFGSTGIVTEAEVIDTEIPLG